MKIFFKRLKNPVVISSIVALVYIFISPSLHLPDWTKISASVIALIYAIFGIVNNPTDKNG